MRPERGRENPGTGKINDIQKVLFENTWSNFENWGYLLRIGVHNTLKLFTFWALQPTTHLTFNLILPSLFFPIRLGDMALPGQNYSLDINLLVKN